MAWMNQDVAGPGQYLLLKQTGGVWIDPFGTVQADEILQRVRQFAVGWSPTRIDLQFGYLLGIGGHTYIFGRAESAVATELVQAQVQTAMDSFLTISNSAFSVAVSDSDSDAVPDGKDQWAGTLQIIAIAVIAVAVVYGVKQLREISE